MATPCSFISSLSEAALKKAKIELNEDPNTRDQVILDLRKAIEEKEGSEELESVQFERKDDAFLIRFLRARKFNIERSLELYINYYQCRIEFSEVFEDFTPQSVEMILKSGIINVLDDRTTDGTKVICFDAVKWDMDSQPFPHIVRSLVLVLEKLLEDEETQVHGVSLFESFEGIDFAKMCKIAQHEAYYRGMLKILQDGFPIRLKHMHVIKQPWYISIVMMLIWPFLKEKLRQRIHMHGYELSTLHEFMNPQNLPLDFGGSLPPMYNFNAGRLFWEVGVVTENTNKSTEV